MELRGRFADHLPADTLQEWTPVTDDDMLCLEASNRYFTPSYLASEYDPVELGDIIDPLGLLKAKTAGSRRTEDNEVLYYERIVCKDKPCVTH